MSMLGEQLAPVRPVLAAAQRAGEVSPEAVAIITKALAGVDRDGFDSADVEAGERLLTSFALSFGPADLKRLADQVVDRMDPDGTKPTDQLNDDRQNLRLTANRDGSYGGEFRLTGSLGTKLAAVLSPLAKPRLDRMPASDGTTIEPIDERTYGQRMHDALENVCDRMLRAGDLPESGGIPATVIVTMSREDLLTGRGYGTTSDGVLISTEQVLELANQADIIPTVLTASGAVLDLGRTRRVASPSQTLALIARDGGCSFPGCTHPPQWCERHHITAWVDGGLTNVDNLTLLCRYHHHNFAARGWTCQLNLDRLPEWSPPWWIDRQRQPVINHRILGRLAARARSPVPYLRWAATRTAW